MNTPPKELRLALCMRGGVSLAVWMGGACREIAALRSATNQTVSDDPRDLAQRKVYRRILKLAGYDEVTVDVIAGTSAGGLNGALLAAHLVHGMPFDSQIRDIWLQLGDLASLTRDPQGGKPAPSLLEGDDGFYGRLARQLDKLVPATPPPGHNAPRLVRLILTATRLRPREQYLRTSAGEPLLAFSSHAHMTFRHYRTDDGNVHDIFTDLPANSKPHRDKLAYAARATSSFPGAFEAAEIGVTKPSPVDEHNDLFGLISETGVPDHAENGQVEVMDGGVLDNIPLSWAIRAVASAPADRPVDRWLLYLQPVPPSNVKAPAGAARDSSLSRLLLTLKSFLSAKANSESLLDDAAELSDAWTTAQRLSGAAGGLPGNPSFAALPDPCPLLQGYAKAVACTEADRLARLIEDPIALLGPDPLPIPDCRAFRDPEQQFLILKRLRGPAIPELVADSPLETVPDTFSSPLAAARAVALALDWVQAVENTGAVPAELHRVVRETRDSLYETRFACEVLLAARDRLMLRDTADDVATWVSNANQLLCRLVGDGFTDETRTWPEVLASVAKAAVEGTVPDQQPVPCLAPIWARVNTLCRKFGKELGDLADVTGFTALREASDDEDKMHKVLRIAEILLGPLRPDPLAEPTRIQMYAISAAAQSPVERLLVTREPADETDRVNLKLSGNQLLNFASFLSSRWRLNDWTWGRLDAASSLVDVVARSDRLGVPDPATLEWLQGLHNELEQDERVRGLNGSWDKFKPTNDNVRKLLTTWLHWNILRQELPLLEALGTADAPPEPDLLKKTPRSVDTLPARTTILGEVGEETVRELLRKRPLRQAGLRLGLVAWRSLLPSGGFKAWAIKVLLGLAKPLIVPPLLIGFLAPALSVLSAAFAWGAVTAATGRWIGSPGHVLVAVGAVGAGVFLSVHYPRTRKPLALIALLLAAALIGWPRWTWIEGLPVVFTEPTWLRVTLIGVLGALAVWFSLLGVVVARLRFVAALLTGFVAAFAALLIAYACGWAALDGWPAAGVVYLTIGVETALLTYRYPRRPAEPVTSPPENRR